MSKHMKRILTYISIFLLLVIAIAEGSNKSLEEIPAEDVLSKIANDEQVEYKNVIIKGDLNLDRLHLPTERIEQSAREIMVPELSEDVRLVNSSIEITDSIIDGNIYFNNTKFNKVSDFTNTTFNKKVFFRGSRFYDIALFGRSNFKEDVSFAGARFCKYADFRESLFNRDVHFWNSLFEDTADLTKSQFRGIADFQGASFSENSYFVHSQFNGYAKFWDSQFRRIADFSGSKFNDSADFERTSFYETAIFAVSQLCGGADFSNSQFRENADFGNSQFSKEINFNDAAFNRITTFNNSRFSDDALFEGATFNGILYLTRTKYERFYIKYVNIKKLGYDDTAYPLLIENFKRLGFYMDADKCYYDYRNEGRRYQPWVHKPLDWMLMSLYGYGTRPELPFIESLIVIIMFGFFWRNDPKIDKKTPVDALGFSATVFLSGTKLFVDPPKFPETTWGSFTNLTRIAFNLERVLGALFSIVFFLAIGRVIIR